MDYCIMEIQDTTKVDGESTLKGYEKHIEILSYSHGVSNPIQWNTSNTGRTSGRPNVGEMTVTKQLDATTPALNFYCAQAKTLGKVNLKLVRQDADASNILYMEYSMENTMISSVSVGGGGDSVPTETVTLNFSKLTWTYNPQDVKTNVDSKQKQEKFWDMATNTGTT